MKAASRIPIEDLRPFIKMAAEEMGAWRLNNTIKEAVDYFNWPLVDVECGVPQFTAATPEGYKRISLIKLLIEAMLLHAESKGKLEMHVCVKEDAA